jgi:hypothetical protein
MNAIPGYDEAVTTERKARNVIYLGQKVTICGQRVNNITPYTLAILTEAENPFLFGGEQSHIYAAQFIAALQDKKDRNMPLTLQALLAMELEDIAEEISHFVDATFMDAPRGGNSEDAPIASGIAWLEYRMAREPFRWDCEKTLHTSLRRIYQLLRCDEKYQGETVVNLLSSEKEREWLVRVNDALKDGSVTIEDVMRSQITGAYMRQHKRPPTEAETEAILAPWREETAKIERNKKTNLEAMEEAQ